MPVLPSCRARLADPSRLPRPHPLFPFREYLSALLGYLTSFYERTQPLAQLARTLNKVRWLDGCSRLAGQAAFSCVQGAAEPPQHAHRRCECRDSPHVRHVRVSEALQGPCRAAPFGADFLMLTVAHGVLGPRFPKRTRKMRPIWQMTSCKN